MCVDEERVVKKKTRKERKSLNWKWYHKTPVNLRLRASAGPGEQRRSKEKRKLGGSRKNDGMAGKRPATGLKNHEQLPFGH